MLRRVAALFVSILLLTGCGLLGGGSEEPPEGYVYIDGEWVPPEASGLWWHDGRYDMDPVPLAEYCAQLQAAHDVDLLEGAPEEGNWVESTSWPEWIDEARAMAGVAPDEEEAEMWRVLADSQPSMLDLTMTEEERALYGDAMSELRERTKARCDMILP